MPRAYRIRRGRGFEAPAARGHLNIMKGTVSAPVAESGSPFLSPSPPASFPKKPRKRIKCKGAGAGKVFCWNPKEPQTPGRWFVDEGARLRPSSPAQMVLPGLTDVDCRPSGSGRVFCWDDEGGGGNFHQAPGGLSGLGFMPGTDPIVKVGVVAVLVIVVAKIL